MTPEAASKTVLIADDELNMRRVLEAILRREGYDVITAANGVEALSGMSANVHTVITDLKMPGLDGMGLLKKLSADYPDVPVVMITAHGSVENAVEAVKLGAFDYLEKPFEQEQIRQIVTKAMNTYALARRDATPEVPAGRGRFKLIGQSGAIRQIFVAVEKVADTPSTVLITGESGTGKELIARALHANSSRKAGPFIKINCAAIPKTLMESELFGYEKGAFTGAVGSKPGRFELADTGTLFLDEIGEMPLQLQAKLLRVLQEREIEPLGSDKISKVDVRVIAATNVDLRKRVSDGAFRADLYYRLNVLSIDLPPLRKCLDDLPDICARLIEDISASGDFLNARITPSGLSALARYDWPGNVRELRNILERALILSDSGRLTGDDFVHILPVSAEAGPGPAPQMTGSVVPYAEAEAEFEKQTLEHALAASNGQISEAARMLRISRATFYKKLAKFGLASGSPPV